MSSKQKKTNRGNYVSRSRQFMQMSRLKQVVVIVVIVAIVAALGLTGWGIYHTQVGPYNEPAFLIDGETYDMGYFIDTLKSYYGNVSAGVLSSYTQYGEQEIEQFAGYVEEQVITNQIILRGSAALGLTIDREEIKADLKALGLPVTDEYIDLFMAEQLVEQQVPSSQPQVHVKAILAESEATAQAAIDRLVLWEDFEVVATEVSRLAGAAVASNNLGWLTYDEANLRVGSEKFAEIVFAGPPDVIVGPVYDDTVTKKYGYWVMKVLEKKEATDIVSASVNVEGLLVGSLEEAEDVISRLNAGADIDELAREVSQLPTAAEKGAEIGWFSEWQLKGDSLAVFDLEVNEISQPIADNQVETTGGYWVYTIVEKDNKRELSVQQKNTLITNLLETLEAELQKDPDYSAESLLTPEMRVFAIDQVVIAQGKGSVFIRNSKLPDGLTDTPYEQQLEVYGTRKGNTWSITQGSLPTGLTLDPETGLVSGTPVYAGGSSFTIEVNNGLRYWQQEMFMRVNFTVSITTESLTAGKVGEAYSADLEAMVNSDEYLWAISEGTLPDGLKLDPLGGAITGTPETAGSFTFTLMVKDPYSTAEKVFTLDITE